MAGEKNKGGRPTKYDEKYCAIAEAFLSKGKSIIQLSAHIDVATKTIYNWQEEHPEFLHALTRGQELSQAYWEGELCEMMYSKEVNAPLVKLYFANRFKWTDKTEVKSEVKAEVKAEVTVIDEETQKAIGKYLDDDC